MKKFFKSLDIDDYLFFLVMAVLIGAVIYLGDSINWDFFIK